MTKSVLIPIANGSEEIETVTLINVLRRAGFEVTTASVAELTIQGAQKIKITADKLLADCKNQSYDGIFLPGGMPGASHLQESEILKAMLIQQAQTRQYYGAICASPAIVLAYHGLLENKKATCYPGFEDKLPTNCFVSQKVVIDGTCITAQSPGTAQEFALQIIAQMENDSLSQKIRSNLC